MKVRMQVAIPGVPYSVNEQTFDTDGLSHEDIIAQIAQAKAVSEAVVSAFSNLDPETKQLKAEYSALKELVERQQVSGEQKSLFISKLKEAVGDAEYERIKKEVTESNDYAKITAHASWAKGQ